ncbi:hypothetical protein VPHD479_0391 [Vibrio phage D479]
MKTLQTYMVEALKRSVPIRWNHSNNYTHDQSHGEFEVGGETYVLTTSYEYQKDMMTISFALIGDRGQDMSITGTGSELTVLGTVLAGVREVLHDHQPMYLYFEAADNEPSRKKLYERLTRRFAGDIGYAYSFSNGNFLLTRR